MKQVPRIASGSSGDGELLGKERKLASQNRQEAQGKGKGQVSQSANDSSGDAEILEKGATGHTTTTGGSSRKGKQVPQSANSSSSDAEILGEQKPALQNQQEGQGKVKEIPPTPSDYLRQRGPQNLDD